MSATPRPWHVWMEGDEVWGIRDARNRRIVETDAGFYEPRIEDADLIVRAVNAFDALLAVAKLAADDDTLSNAPLEEQLRLLDVQHPNWRAWV